MAKTGRPAFPTNESNYQKDWSDSGMSLRDWFAGQALAGLIPSITIINRQAVAKTAYELADAMLQERAKFITVPDPEPLDEEDGDL